MQPFLKWPGGKRWIISYLSQKIPARYNRYFEPFLGGGAVFFALNPAQATISDLNEGLINLYKVMRDSPEELKSSLLVHQKLHSKEYYYKIRSERIYDPIQFAAQFLYLNRACYNGMYRVNNNGFFNVPIGTKSNFVYDIDLFETYADVLRGKEIYSCDFEQIINLAGANDLIFADPPYALSKNSAFIQYNETLFNWKDQLRLFHSLSLAKDRGAKVFLTNANSRDVEDLYRQAGFLVEIVKRESTISGKESGRQKVDELFIYSE